MTKHESESEVFFVSRSANNGSDNESNEPVAATPQDDVSTVRDGRHYEHRFRYDARGCGGAATRRLHSDGGANACRPTAEVHRDRNNSHGAGDLHLAVAAGTPERHTRPVARLPFKIPAFTGSEDILKEDII